MVAFGDQLLRERVTEWRAYYVSYEILKDYISEMIRDASYHERFLHELGNNVLRFMRFYERQEKRALDVAAGIVLVVAGGGAAPGSADVAVPGRKGSLRLMQDALAPGKSPAACLPPLEVDTAGGVLLPQVERSLSSPLGIPLQQGAHQSRDLPRGAASADNFNYVMLGEQQKDIERSSLFSRMDSTIVEVDEAEAARDAGTSRVVAPPQKTYSTSSLMMSPNVPSPSVGRARAGELQGITFGGNNIAPTTTDIRRARRLLVELGRRIDRLVRFAETNCTAVRKIVKKFDKEVNRRKHLRDMRSRHQGQGAELLDLQTDLLAALGQSNLGSARRRLEPIRKALTELLDTIAAPTATPSPRGVIEDGPSSTVARTSTSSHKPDGAAGSNKEACKNALNTTSSTNLLSKLKNRITSGATTSTTGLKISTDDAREFGTSNMLARQLLTASGTASMPISPRESPKASSNTAEGAAIFLAQRKVITLLNDLRPAPAGAGAAADGALRSKTTSAVPQAQLATQDAGSAAQTSTAPTNGSPAREQMQRAPDTAPSVAARTSTTSSVLNLIDRWQWTSAFKVHDAHIAPGLQLQPASHYAASSRSSMHFGSAHGGASDHYGMGSGSTAAASVVPTGDAAAALASGGGPQDDLVLKGVTFAAANEQPAGMLDRRQLALAASSGEETDHENELHFDHHADHLHDGLDPDSHDVDHDEDDEQYGSAEARGGLRKRRGNTKFVKGLWRKLEAYTRLTRKLSAASSASGDEEFGVAGDSSFASPLPRRGSDAEEDQPDPLSAKHLFRQCVSFLQPGNVVFSFFMAVLCVCAWSSEACELFVRDANPGILNIGGAKPIPEWQPYVTIWTTAVVLRLLTTGWPSDVTLIFATLFLCLCGVLSVDKAWSGFSNPVVLSVAVLGIVAHGVEQTGSVEKIFLALLRPRPKKGGVPGGEKTATVCTPRGITNKLAGATAALMGEASRGANPAKALENVDDTSDEHHDQELEPMSFKQATFRLLLPAIVLNVGMSNTAVMSILVPIIEKWAVEVNLSKNLFLMPLSYVLLISGTIAIFATSSNLIAQGLMQDAGQRPFGTFEIAPVALLATLATVFVIFFFMETLFPDFAGEEDEQDDDDAEMLMSRREEENAPLAVASAPAAAPASPSAGFRKPIGSPQLAALSTFLPGGGSPRTAHAMSPLGGRGLAQHALVAPLLPASSKQSTEPRSQGSAGTRTPEHQRVLPPQAAPLQRPPTSPAGKTAAARASINASFADATSETPRAMNPLLDRSQTFAFGEANAKELGTPELVGEKQPPAAVSETKIPRGRSGSIAVRAGGGSRGGGGELATNNRRANSEKKRFMVSVQMASPEYLGKKISECDFLPGSNAAKAAAAAQGAENPTATAVSTPQPATSSSGNMFPFGGIVQVERLGQRVNFEHPAFTFQYYDIVALYTTATQIVSLHKNPGLNLLCRDMGDPVINRLADAMEITEIVLDVACPLIGQKMCDESNVRKLYAAKVLAVRPLSLLESLRGAVSNAVAGNKADRGKVLKKVHEFMAMELRGRKYELGDSLLVLAREGFAERQAGSGDFFGVRALYKPNDADEEPGGSVELAGKKKKKSGGKTASDDVVTAEQQNKPSHPFPTVPRITPGLYDATDVAAVGVPDAAETSFSGDLAKSSSELKKNVEDTPSKEADKVDVAAVLHWRKQVASLVILALMIGTVSTDTLPLLTACMSATYGLVVTNCLTKEQAFSAIKIRTILTIVGAFGLGEAIGSTKVALLVASGITDCLAPFGETGLLVGIFLVTVLLGIVFHATAVVILIFPVCLETANRLNVPVHRAVCILMIGAGCQMLSPVSYQTNLMALSAGNYSFNDFPRLGLPIVLLIGCVAVPATEFFIE